MGWGKTVLLSGTFALLILVAMCLNLRTDAGISGNQATMAPFTGTSSFEEEQHTHIVQLYSSFFQQALEEEKIPGAAVAIVKNNQVLHLQGYGVKEWGTTDSVDINTVFRLGSVSKGFAGILAGLMVNERYFDWDTPIVHYLPEFRFADTSRSNTLTLKHVLSMSTGLPPHTYTDLLDINFTYDEIRPLLTEIYPTVPPGTEYSYQNVAFSLVDDVMRSATGYTYNQLLKNHIFVPLKMNNASTCYEAMVYGQNVARPHVPAGNGLWRADRFNERYYSVAPAAGVNASITDMATWLIALLGNYPDLITPDILTKTCQPLVNTPLRRLYRHSWNNLTDIYYGLGWRIIDCMGHRIIYHGGFVRGYRAEIAFCPSENIGIVVLFNSSNQLSNSCIPVFWQICFDEPELNEKLFADKK